MTASNKEREHVNTVQSINLLLDIEIIMLKITQSRMLIPRDTIDVIHRPFLCC